MPDRRSPRPTGAPAQPVEPTAAPTRLAFLDGLRGLAATWVVLFHLGAGGQIVALLALLPPWLDAVLIDAGYFGVAIFFVLSGFVIARSIGDAAVDRTYFARFALRRSIRLDLPYWASIAITLCVLTAKALVRPGVSTPSVSVENLLAHMFYLQDLLGFPEISEVYWTLCYEIQFYLIFCALAGVATSLGRSIGVSRARGIVFTVVAVVSLLWPLLGSLQVRGLALSHLHGFLLGAFVSWTLSGRLAKRWLALYGLALLGLWFLTRQPFTIVCLVTGAVIHAAALAGRLDTLLAGRVPQFLGRISYSLYLLHVPIFGGTFALASLVLGDSVAERAVALLAVIAANLIGAWCAWRWIERPSTALSQRLRPEAVRHA